MNPSTPNPPAAWGLVPLVPVVLALGLGILVADRIGYTPPVYWLAGMFVAMAITFAFWLRPQPQRWKAVVGSGLVLLSVFAFGGWRANLAYAPERASFFIKHLQPGDVLAGTITGLRPGENRLRAEVKLQALVHDSLGSRRVSGRMLLYLPPDEASATLKTGDRLVFAGVPQEIGPPLNPGVFDLQAYWQRKGIFHQLFLREAEEWRLAGSSGTGLTARAESWRRAWFHTFQEYLTGDRLAVAAALVLGKRDLITDDVQSAYTETGAVHVLAVSGLHVGIIYLILRFLLITLLKLDRRPKGKLLVAFLSVVCVWGFALVSGLSPSVQRAAIMFSVLALGGVLYRKTHVFNTLAIAAGIMLLVNPGQLFQVGFQLSFTAIIGIVSFTGFFDRLVYWPLRVLRGAWSAMAASTGAQLGTLPLSLLYFKQFPTWFLFSGTIVILFAFATMFAGLLHGLMAGILGLTGPATATGWLLSTVVGWQNALIFFFQDLPWSLLRTPGFTAGQSILLALTIGLSAVFVRWRSRRVLLAAGGCLLAMFFWARPQVQREVDGAMLTVFHRSGGSLVDVDTGPSGAWSFGEQPAAKDLNWSAGPRRAARGYTPLATLTLAGADTTLASGILRRQYGLLHFADTRWLVLDGAQRTPDFSGLSDATHVLVTNNFRPDKLPEISGADQVWIIDASNAFYRIDDWQTWAAKTGENVHITAESGAYTLVRSAGS